MERTPTKAEQREHLKKLRDIEKLIAGFEKSDADSMTFDRDQMDTIERAVACHDAVISLDMKKREVPDTNVGKWIPITERVPDSDRYVLLSFSNSTGVDIGRYEEDDEGGAFYPGDEGMSYSSYGIFVNAWMELPAPYREEEDE